MLCTVGNVKVRGGNGKVFSFVFISLVQFIDAFLESEEIQLVSRPVLTILSFI